MPKSFGFRPYVTLLDLFPPMPNDAASCQRAVFESQQYLVDRETQSATKEDISFLAVIDHHIGILEKAKSMIATHRITTKYRGNLRQIPNIFDYEIIALTPTESSQGNEASPK